MEKYDIYEKEGAIFRGRAGSGFVTEIYGPNGWEIYDGDKLAPVTFGDYIRTASLDAAGPNKESK